MGQIGLLFVLKIVSLLAAVAQTVGFVGLFALEALDPYKWQLLIGGTVAIMLSEGLSYLLTKRMASVSIEAKADV
jgi:hypothetical protein